VERLTEKVGFTELPRAEEVAAAYSPEGAGRLYGGMARKVAELGFTVNFGPVVDLNLNPNNQIIAKYGRAFGKTSEASSPMPAPSSRRIAGRGCSPRSSISRVTARAPTTATRASSTSPRLGGRPSSIPTGS
jgi:hypothetical protein